MAEYALALDEAALKRYRLTARVAYKAERARRRADHIPPPAHDGDA
jgi:hypothetical protein